MVHFKTGFEIVYGLTMKDGLERDAWRGIAGSRPTCASIGQIDDDEMHLFILFLINLVL